VDTGAERVGAGKAAGKRAAHAPTGIFEEPYVGLPGSRCCCLEENRSLCPRTRRTRLGRLSTAPTEDRNTPARTVNAEAGQLATRAIAARPLRACEARS